MKVFYPNLMSSQNITAKTYINWVADITEIELAENKKLYIFICVDAHSNTIITYSISRKTITSHAIVKCLTKTIKKRFSIKPNKKVTVHTDRGTQFSGKVYQEFTEKFKEYMDPSMSRLNTPTDNAVAERFMRTIKQHQIGGKVLEQALQEHSLEETKIYRSVVNQYVKSLNERPNRKSLLRAPKRHDNDVATAAMLMVDPLHPRGFSERFGKDYRIDEINNFKNQNKEVVGILEQIAARKAEIVDSTPFDNFEDNFALELIDKRLMELYEIIQNNPLIVKAFVENAIEPVGEDVLELRDELREEMQNLNYKIDMLLPKERKNRETQILRDPVDNNLFPIFFTNAGTTFPRRTDLKQAQLRVTYTILYHCGLRINEIRYLNEEDIQRAISAAQLSLIHHKTNKPHVHVLSKKAIKDLKGLNAEFSIIFVKYKFKFLFGKNQPITGKNLIKMVNQDLKITSERFGIPFNIKSHSFRVNMITNLLKVTSVQNTANIMGHQDIRSTMSYNRYALSKNQIQELLDKIEEEH